MTPFPRWLRVLGVVVSLVPVALGLVLLAVGLAHNDDPNMLGLLALVGVAVLLLNGWLLLLAVAWGRGWALAPALNLLGLLAAGLYLALSGPLRGQEWLLALTLLWPALPLLAWGAWRLGKVARRQLFC